jgi:hypothetical protein
MQDGTLPSMTIAMVNHSGKITLSGIASQEKDYGI